MCRRNNNCCNCRRCGSGNNSLVESIFGNNNSNCCNQNSNSSCGCQCQNCCGNRCSCCCQR